MFKIVATLFFLVLLQTTFAQIPGGLGRGVFGGGMGGNNSSNRKLPSLFFYFVDFRGEQHDGLTL